MVVMRAETEISSTAWGRGRIGLEGSDSDPLHELGPLSVLGAGLVSREQVLPWGDIV